MDAEPLLILVPAWNEADAVAVLLDDLAQLRLAHDVVVIDNGSSDSTAAVARRRGVPVISLPVNLGRGGAMRAGYRWATKHGYQYSVQLDAGGRSRPEEIATVVAPVRRGEMDVCVGSRFAAGRGYRLGALRRLAIRLLSALVSALIGTRISDTTSGFKAANSRAMKVFAREFPMEYLGDTVEALIIGHKAGLVIGEAAVSPGRPRTKPTPPAWWRSAMFLVRALSAVLIAATRKAAPAEARQ